MLEFAKAHDLEITRLPFIFFFSFEIETIESTCSPFCSVLSVLSKSRPLSLLGHNKHHNDALLGMFYILAPLLGITKPLLIFIWGVEWKRESIHG